jgi:hypothetical protein
MSFVQSDSPLSITASVTGILTFVYALLAIFLTYIILLRNMQTSDTDIQRFYAAFSACALETDLVRRDILGAQKVLERTLRTPRDGVTENYLLDPNSLARLYSQVREVEVDLQSQAARIVGEGDAEDGGWGVWKGLVGKGRWASRAKELEARLGRREALTGRLVVIQMSLLSM